MNLEKAIHQKTFESPLQKAIINIFYTSNWLRDQQQEIFKKFDILPQHYNVLRILKGRHPKAVSAGDIKSVMLDKGTDLTRLIDKLVKLEFVIREECKENRRKLDIKLTPKGINILNQINKPIQTQSEQLKKKLSANDAKLLSNLLDKLRD